MDLSGRETILIAFIVVLAVVLIGILILLLRRLRARRDKLLSDLDQRPELSQDRAFNRIAMARREAGILNGQGVDVHRAQELIAEAQGSFDTRHYDDAYRSAQSAHEALVNARNQGALTTGTPLTSRPVPSGAAPTTAVAPAGPAAEPPPVAAPALPKNRAESQFQLRILSDELAALGSRRARDPMVKESRSLQAQAQSAFDRGDYTDSFRLALKGRRALGGSVEGLPAAPGAGAGPRGPTGEGTGAGDPARTAEAVAGSERCPDCGYPMLAGDSFCRGCGKPRALATCGSCGAPRVGDEAFCGKCGARFA